MYSRVIYDFNSVVKKFIKLELQILLPSLFLLLLGIVFNVRVKGIMSPEGVEFIIQ